MFYLDFNTREIQYDSLFSLLKFFVLYIKKHDIVFFKYFFVFQMYMTWSLNEFSIS